MTTTLLAFALCVFCLYFGYKSIIKLPKGLTIQKINAIIGMADYINIRLSHCSTIEELESIISVYENNLKQYEEIDWKPTNRILAQIKSNLRISQNKLEKNGN